MPAMSLRNLDPASTDVMKSALWRRDSSRPSTRWRACREARARCRRGAKRLAGDDSGQPFRGQWDAARPARLSNAGGD